ncbi:MAG: peptide-methionine (S)-S-oxide reductase [Planctomycetes bacterium]|nr:peptide-methionine (S)-S-oxide reductase [Planctomycetota bacterium]
MADSKGRRQVATFGGGCFWCVEAVLQQIDGVHDLKSGFMGGHVDNPTYDDICTKTTGHIEVVQVKFDPDVLSYEKLLKWFFKSHDPTSMDRQGGDAGPQYRSAIFWHGDEQKQTAETLIKKIDEADVFASKIVTVVREAEKFWIADAEHQDYYRRNKDQRYCQLVIAPKLGKLGLDK